MADDRLRELERQGAPDIVLFRERVRVGLIGGIECVVCRGVGYIHWINGDYIAGGNPEPCIPEQVECATCKGAGRRSPEEWIRLASYWGHKGAQEECPVFADHLCYANPIPKVIEEWGEAVAAACVQGALDACTGPLTPASIAKAVSSYSFSDTYKACALYASEPHVREGTRQAGIRYAFSGGVIVGT